MKKASMTRKRGARRTLTAGAGVLFVLSGALVTFLSQQAVQDAVSAAPSSLGTTPAFFTYAEYSSGDATQGPATVAGVEVTGGNLTIPSGDTLTVGTSYTSKGVLYANGDVAGPTGSLCLYGDNYGFFNNTSTVQLEAGCGTSFTQVAFEQVIFQWLNSNLASISSTWEAMTSTGSEQLSSGTLFLTGTASTLNVFNVPWSDFAGAQSINIDVPTGSTQVLVNATGAPSSASLPLAGVTYTNDPSMAANTWLNLPDATSVSFSGVDLNANLLAPNASVNMSGGTLEGYVYVASLNGSFNANLPSASTITGPAPSTPCPCNATTTTSSSSTTSSSTSTSSTTPTTSSTSSSTTSSTSTSTSTSTSSTTSPSLTSTTTTVFVPYYPPATTPPSSTTTATTPTTTAPTTSTSAPTTSTTAAPTTTQS
ncbi:MAG TPA: choice-of-anchor A family protein, partial [Acidimicrobiales bacterium]|nr:choice-of-anchor A family protein [Acidimicrobiales bacterium]